LSSVTATVSATAPSTVMVSVPVASLAPPVSAAESARRAFIVACVLYQVPTASLFARMYSIAPATLSGYTPALMRP
jgi:hypothetical protein